MTKAKSDKKTSNPKAMSKRATTPDTVKSKVFEPVQPLDSAPVKKVVEDEPVPEPAPKPKPSIPMVKIAARVITPIELEHDVFCEAVGECRCTTRTIMSSEANKQTGTIGMKPTLMRQPDVKTFIAGVVNTIEEPVLELDAMQSALRRKDLRIVR